MRKRTLEFSSVYVCVSVCVRQRLTTESNQMCVSEVMIQSSVQEWSKLQREEPEVKYVLAEVKITKHRLKLGTASF